MTDAEHGFTEDVFDETMIALIAEETAGGKVDELYQKAKTYMAALDEKYEKLRGKAKPKLDIAKIQGLITDNWKTITAVGAAFGVPVSMADPGAFTKVLGLLGNFLPF